MNQKPVATFTNTDEGMESYVFLNEKSGYNVTLKDLDSGMFVPMGFCGIKDLNQAIAKAKKVANVKD